MNILLEKLCKDCVNCGENEICQVPVVNFFNGRQTFLPVHDMRRGGECGSEARLFIAKSSKQVQEPIAGFGYRLLTCEEIIRASDEVRTNNGWQSVGCSYWRGIKGGATCNCFRRSIMPIVNPQPCICGYPRPLIEPLETVHYPTEGNDPKHCLVYIVKCGRAECLNSVGPYEEKQAIKAWNLMQNAFKQM